MSESRAERDTAVINTSPPRRFERFKITYSSGTAIDAFYARGATLREVQVGHVLATVEAVEDSRVSALA